METSDRYGSADVPPRTFEGLNRPWWWEWAPRVEAGDEAIPARADVAIVGSGYAGLSAALTLARAGRDVVILEAREPGHGASSRAGGMIGGGHMRELEPLVRQYGESQALAILQEGLNSYEFTRNLIESESIECHFKAVGRLRAAWRQKDFVAMQRDIERLSRKIRYDVTVVSKAEMANEIQTDLYAGGSIYNNHGGLHSALFHSGLSNSH